MYNVVLQFPDKCLQIACIVSSWRIYFQISDVADCLSQMEIRERVYVLKFYIIYIEFTNKRRGMKNDIKKRKTNPDNQKMLTHQAAVSMPRDHDFR